MANKEFKYGRSWYFQALWGIVITAGLILKLSLNYKHHTNLFDGRSFYEHRFGYLLLVAIIGLDIACWYFAFDKTIAILINSEGFKIKDELLPWDNLIAYKFEVSKATSGDDSDTTNCIFYFKDDTPTRTLKMSEFDIATYEIIKAITQCSTNPNIIFKGFENLK
jgi:hypothetical protein